MSPILIRNVRPYGAASTDILIESGRFAAIAPNLTPPPGALIEDGANALALPGVIEGHTHLDKTVWGLPFYRNTTGPTLQDKIDNERNYRAATNHDAGAQSLLMAKLLLANGTTRIRTHVDIDTDAGLKHLHAQLATRAALADVIDMQVVAFPQSGLLIRPGTTELLDAALTAGADIIGGLDPCSMDRDPKGHLDLLFALAQKHAKPIDIHLHEPGEMGAFSLDLLLERTQALGMHGKVVVSHAFCLGGIEPSHRDSLLARMARLQVAIATTAPASRPVPTIASCRAAGVTLFGGNDGIRDTWTPQGVPDMLFRAMLIANRNDARSDEAMAHVLETITTQAAAGCHFANYGLTRGNRADLVLLHAETIPHAIVAQPPRTLVLSAGKIVARNGALT